MTGSPTSLRATYDSFVQAGLDSFDPAKIILIRSHVARFWVAEDGTIAPTNVDSRDAPLLEALDAYFAEQTGCSVGRRPGLFSVFCPVAGLRPPTAQVDRDDLVALCTPDPGGAGPGAASEPPANAPRGASAADYVVGAIRGAARGRGQAAELLHRRQGVVRRPLALAYLEQVGAEVAMTVHLVSIRPA